MEDSGSLSLFVCNTRELQPPVGRVVTCQCGACAAMRVPNIRGLKDHISIRMLHSGSKPKTRRIPETMVCRILVIMWFSSSRGPRAPKGNFPQLLPVQRWEEVRSSGFCRDAAVRTVANMLQGFAVWALPATPFLTRLQRRAPNKVGSDLSASNSCSQTLQPVLEPFRGAVQNH